MISYLPKYFPNLISLVGRFGKAAYQVPTSKTNYRVYNSLNMNACMRHIGSPDFREGDQILCKKIQTNGYPVFKIINRDNAKEWPRGEIMVPITADKPISDFGLVYMSKPENFWENISGMKPLEDKTTPYKKEF